jgi:endoribonuclease Dicer
VHMVERGNDVHRRILSRITNLDAAMLDWTETLCNFPEGAVPPHSLKETINPYYSDSEDEDRDGVSAEYIQDPTTGGRIYLQDATTALYRYAASARSKGLHISHNQRLFEFQDVRNDFESPRAHVCTIVLPGTPVDKVSGGPSLSEAQARRLACFKACRSLFERGLLDFRLVPLPPALRVQKHNDLRNLEKDWSIDHKTSGTRSYDRKRPYFWVNAIRGDATTMYPNVIFIKDAEDSPEYSPIIILTRQPLPDIQSFRLFSSGVGIPVHFYKAAPLQIAEGRLRDIHLYSVRICRAIMNKPLSCSLENMLYFFLPLSSNWRPPTRFGLDVSDISDDVPWNLVSLAANHWAVPINKDSPEQLELDLKDAIVQDRWIEFTRRYKVVKVRHDLTPLSKPADSPVCFMQIFSATLLMFW